MHLREESTVTAGVGPKRLAITVVPLSWLAIFVMGAVEGLFGRTIYLNDFISYLDVSRAVTRLDWPNIFNPMWSPGYPSLVAFARTFAPATPEGEWYAASLLNLAIFLGAYGAWRFLVREAIALHRPASADLADHPVAVWTTWWLFLGCCLGLENVSSVSPDLLVTAFFILGAAITLSLIRRPSVSRAVMLGAVLGVAVWVKGVLVPLAAILLSVVFVACCIRRVPWASLGWAIVSFVPLFSGYVAALSWSFGALTLGATGPLNYAFQVNHLPHWYHWRGGPPPFGAPIHPTRQLLPDLPVFEFASPFPHSTYPPYENIAYWYQGFHQVHSLWLQILAIGRSLYHLTAAVVSQPILYCVVLCLLVCMMRREWRRTVWAAALAGWPLFLPALLGLGTYMVVQIEQRYLSPFVLILGLLPLAPLLHPDLAARRALAMALLVIMTAGGIGELWAADCAKFSAAMNGDDYHNAPQWRLAEALIAHGIREDDKVALVNGYVAQERYHWAYVDHLHIVAEFGALPWRIAPRERTKFDHYRIGPPDQDYGQLFWVQLTPEQRAEVIEAFRSSGAQMIVSLSNPLSAPEPGWTALTGTGAWIYDLRK
jgi:hypothetical protein